MAKRPLILGLAVGATFLWLALRNVNFGDVLAALADARFSLVVPFLALLIVFYVLKVMRWRNLIHASYTAPIAGLAAPMMIGFAANNLLPFRAGELIRVFIVGERFRIPKAYALGTLVVERFFDLIAVALITSAGLAATYFLDIEVEGANQIYGTMGLVIGVSTLVLLLLSRANFSKLAGAPRFLPEKLGQFVGGQLARFQSGLRPIADEGRILSVLANSVLQWLAIVACLYVSLIALEIEVSLAAPAILLGIIVMGISLPSSPGYIGTIELAFVLGLGLFGVGAEVALASALFYHVVSFASVTLAGLYYYVRGPFVNRN